MKIIKQTLCILTIAVLLIACVACDGLSEEDVVGGIAVPYSATECVGKNYEEVGKKFETAGFTNIKHEILYDLTTGWLKSDGEIDSVKVDRKSAFSKGQKYESSVEVIITYHTWKNSKGVTEIQMPYSSDEYENGEWTLSSLVSHLQNLGFTEINTEKYTYSGYEYDEIFSIEIDDGWQGFDKGAKYRSDKKVEIGYYELSENLTVSNCQDLANFLSGDGTDYMTFANTYDGKYIEYDACVVTASSTMGGTSFIIEIRVGNYATSVASNPKVWVDIETPFAREEQHLDNTVQVGDNVKVIGKVSKRHADVQNMMYVDAVYFMKRL